MITTASRTAFIALAEARTAIASARHAADAATRTALLTTAIESADEVLAASNSLEARRIRNEARWML
ncbi:hypothetical protein ACTHQY_11465 [Rhodococcoides corynebacterioides]|uniref:hypothetical protein n=1 Tax=Rhodococcoides corynebacterioides TaxID=53972 RepID=UPI003F7FCD98